LLCWSAVFWHLRGKILQVRIRNLENYSKENAELLEVFKKESKMNRFITKVHWQLGVEEVIKGGREAGRSLLLEPRCAFMVI
jgi:hypothetical protein